MFLDFEKLEIANIILGLFFIIIYFLFRKWKPEKRESSDILLLLCGVGIIFITILIKYIYKN